MQRYSALKSSQLHRLLIVLCLVFTAESALGQGVLTVIAGNIAVKDILKSFEGTSNRLLQNAGQQGDILGSKLGNELRIATRDASIALSEQQDKLFSQLAPDEQNMLISLNQFVQAANQGVGRATSIAEIANLNLIEFTNRLPFTRKVNFYLSSVDGLTQPYAETAYDLHLRGLGLGVAPGDRKYNLEITVAGKPLPLNAIRPISATDVDVDIPHDLLESAFQADKPVNVEVLIKSTVTLKTTYLGVFTSSKAYTYEVPLALILLPRFPGVLRGVEPLTSQVQDATQHTSSVTHHTVDCHTDRPCNWTQEVDLAADEFAYAVRYSCVGQCGWDYAYRPLGPGQGYAADYTITNDGHKVTLYRHNDGEHDTTVTHYVDFHKLTPVTTPHALGPVKLQYSHPVSLDLDSANTGCAYQLNGTLVTRQTPYIDSGMAESGDHLLVKNSVVKFGDHCRVTLTLQAR